MQRRRVADNSAEKQRNQYTNTGHRVNKQKGMLYFQRYLLVYAWKNDSLD